VPGIHAFTFSTKQDVDGRDKRDHDGGTFPIYMMRTFLDSAE
jgi:hypothetical protein